MNSVRSRLPRLLAFLARHDPDVVCLQETKTEDGGFPLTEIGAAGYRAALSGQKTYNGVAILSKVKGSDLTRGFPGDPIPDERRVMSGVYHGVRVVNAYVVNGQEVGSDKFALKLRWMDVLNKWLASHAGGPTIVVGDWNVTPDDRDVSDPERWRGQVHCTEEERARVKALLAQGYKDLLREKTQEPGKYTWWDYRMLAFPKDMGLRIDLAFGTADIAAACRAVTIDRDERKESAGEGKPSDHAPLIVDVDL